MILYPNLLKYHVINNPIWVSILERISIGDAPYGTHIHNDTLYYKQHNVSLIDATSNAIVTFFSEILGLVPKYTHFDSWKEIKRKVIKDNLIMEYVSRISKEYTLSTTQSKYLLSLIHLYITLKKITPNDINLYTSVTLDNSNVHTYIKSINGLLFDITDSETKIRFETSSNIDETGTEEDEETILDDTQEESLPCIDYEDSTD